MEDYRSRKACIVVVLEKRQIPVNHILLVEQGESRLFGDQVVHQFSQGIRELFIRRVFLSVHEFGR